MLACRTDGSGPEVPHKRSERGGVTFEFPLEGRFSPPANLLKCTSLAHGLCGACADLDVPEWLQVISAESPCPQLHPMSPCRATSPVIDVW